MNESNSPVNLWELLHRNLKNSRFSDPGQQSVANLVLEDFKQKSSNLNYNVEPFSEQNKSLEIFYDLFLRTFVYLPKLLVERCNSVVVTPESQFEAKAYQTIYNRLIESILNIRMLLEIERQNNLHNGKSTTGQETGRQDSPPVPSNIIYP